MSPMFNILVVLCASLIEAALGYPAPIFRRSGHPVMWMGAALDQLEARLNRADLTEARRRINGALALAALLLASVVPAILIQLAAYALLPRLLALLLVAAIASTLLAQRSLFAHVAAVAEALEQNGIEQGRDAVAKLVGRDTASLDAAGVSRAAIESLAENFSDGVVAPLFWGTLLGLPGMAGYKAVNTADSMIGHRTERHEAFGFAAARLDDLVNLVPARLAALLLMLAAAFQRDASPRGALHAAIRDAGRHRSPNAGWPEAACAGALDLKLAGPRAYHGAMIDEPWIGDGRSEAGPADIRRALSLYRTACALQIAGLAVLALLISQA